MAYLNKIDINGRTYYLQHLTDGKYEARLPYMDKDSSIIIQDVSTSGNVGDVDKPVYIKNNKITACNKDIGNEVTPIYMDYGKIKPLSEDVGSTVNPIYMKAGAITASNETVGSGIVPIYMQDGVITPSNSTVGSSIKPIYMDGGVITASTSTVGAINQPIYMNNGEITVCSDNVGSDGVPVYMANGAITACDTISIASGGTGATTAEEALKNFGLTATVTELNYVDGVTSNIQEQFNNHKDRIDVMETFFKEAPVNENETEYTYTLKTIKSDIDKLNGDENTEGSVAKAINDAKYTHPAYTANNLGLYKITVDNLGHISSVAAVTKDDITKLDIPAQDTTYSVAVAKTETEDGVDGLLSAADKAKYDKYEQTIADLQEQINKLKALVKDYHPTSEPEPEPEPEPGEDNPDETE